MSTYIRKDGYRKEEKPNASVMSLLYSHTTTPLILLTPDIGEGGLHTKQYCNISCVSSNLTHFSHYIAGDSARSHRFRARSHKAALTPTSEANLKSRWSPVLLINQFPATPSSDLINLLEQLKELRKIVYLLFTSLL